ncbi:hypothetical protein [Nonomuraea sp. NPDC049129]|uniref:hypothetical protein n=1 Tax=Nonomuraea sp. NPDC049129 TaxID=3155272 RepID=UPI0033C8E4A8
MLDDSGVLPLIDAELGPRPGPPGLPITAVLTCLLLSVNHTGKATLVEAWRIAAFCLTAAARGSACPKISIRCSPPPAASTRLLTG